MDLDKLLFILSCAKEQITLPITEIVCAPDMIKVTTIHDISLYLYSAKVVNDDDKGQTRNSSDADEPTHEGRQ